MSYTITMILQQTAPILAQALNVLYNHTESPAGSYTLQGVGTQTVVTFHRDHGDDQGVLDEYGEKLTVTNAISQFRRELQSVAKDLPTGTAPYLYAHKVLNEAVSDLNNGHVAVEGLEGDNPLVKIRTSLPVAGETGSRIYAAVDSNGDLELVRADTIEAAREVAREVSPFTTVSLIGHQIGLLE